MSVVRRAMPRATAWCLAFAVALTLSLVATSQARAIELTPGPQPDEDQLQPGLQVLYAYRDIKWLREVEPWIEDKGKPGDPLPNLGYYSEEGEPVLTTSVSQFVAAEITGFMKFPTAGQYELEFASNDGLWVFLGADGTEVYKHDGRHVCDTLGAVDVTVPEAGWYPLRILYFQRYKSSCLWLSWRAPGDAQIGEDPVPDEFFAHSP